MKDRLLTLGLVVVIGLGSAAAPLLIQQDDINEAKRSDKISCVQRQESRAIQRRGLRQTIRSSGFLSRNETDARLRRFWGQEHRRRVAAYQTAPPISCRYLK